MREAEKHLQDIGDVLEGVIKAVEEGYFLEEVVDLDMIKGLYKITQIQKVQSLR